MAGATLPRHLVDEKKTDVVGKTESNLTSEVAGGEDGDEPSDEERQVLRRIGDSMPVATWLVAIIELSERFTFYGCQGLFQNYIQRPFDGSEGRGALGLGHEGATG